MDMSISKQYDGESPLPNRTDESFCNKLAFDQRYSNVDLRSQIVLEMGLYEGVKDLESARKQYIHKIKDKNIQLRIKSLRRTLAVQAMPDDLMILERLQEIVKDPDSSQKNVIDALIEIRNQLRS